ncbi:uncharacterized protein LOC110397391 [Numida meleagris]|uniref:uncharacterized protein LOC110397391 n=1 Tax=Numida meleagris TaxID=8996 RepID=UPI000B3D95FA|nr:uncharacterized protein LOC110397391 [Numida meleagris]
MLPPHGGTGPARPGERGPPRVRQRARAGSGPLPHILRRLPAAGGGPRRSSPSSGPQPSSRRRDAALLPAAAPLRARRVASCRPGGEGAAADADPRPAPREGPRGGRARPRRPRVPPPCFALYLETSARRISLGTGPQASPGRRAGSAAAGEEGRAGSAPPRRAGAGRPTAPHQHRERGLGLRPARPRWGSSSAALHAGSAPRPPTLAAMTSRTAWAFVPEGEGPGRGRGGRLGLAATQAPPPGPPQRGAPYRRGGPSVPSVRLRQYFPAWCSTEYFSSFSGDYCLCTSDLRANELLEISCVRRVYACLAEPGVFVRLRLADGLSPRQTHSLCSV